MKYLIGIIIGALIIGGILTISVYYTLGENPGYFVAKFIAVPMGLLGAGFCFVAQEEEPDQGRNKMKNNKSIEHAHKRRWPNAQITRVANFIIDVA